MKILNAKSLNLGTKAHPAVVRVQSEERAQEVAVMCKGKNWRCIIGIEPDKPEDITDIEWLMAHGVQNSTPRKKLGRNAACSCGSGQKFKKCCGATHKQPIDEISAEPFTCSAKLHSIMESELVEPYTSMSTESLLNLVLNSGDTLPRAAFNECVARCMNPMEADDMQHNLIAMIQNSNLWESDLPTGWAPIHAIHILGAIGTLDCIVPLIAGLRRACAHDCYDITETIAAIFADIGSSAIEPLVDILSDASNDWFIRSIALDSLAAIVMLGEEGEQKRQIFALISAIMKNQDEENILRGLAGSILLSCRLCEYEFDLHTFAKEQATWPSSEQVHFTSDDIFLSLAEEEPEIDRWQRDWLCFYDEENIALRKKWRLQDIAYHRWYNRFFRLLNPMGRWLRNRRLQRSLDKFHQERQDRIDALR